jgi:hypothetical protein
MPSERPSHCFMHYHHRLNSVRNKLWKSNKDICKWGKWLHYFERDENQQRAATHTHGCAFVSKSIPDMIQVNVIRADLPDPITEKPLHDVVHAHQIHTCSEHLCGGPAEPGKKCRKGFPADLSDTTYEDPASLRYIYRRTKDADRWVVPYHPETLLIWQGHINFQYVTTKDFARYMTKYATKREPVDLYDVEETDVYHRHITARTIGAMEQMCLCLERRHVAQASR